MNSDGLLADREDSVAIADSAAVDATAADNEWMTGKVGGWALFALGVVGIAAGVWLFVWLGLSKGDQVASVVSVFVGIAGLVVSVAGLITARRTGVTRAAQAIVSSSLGGNAEVVRNVGGNVTSHRATSTASIPTPPASSSMRALASEDAEQSIVGSRIPGSARYIDNISGDVETDR